MKSTVFYDSVEHISTHSASMPSTTGFYDACLKAKQCVPALTHLSDDKRTELLTDIAAELDSAQNEILRANKIDREAATACDNPEKLSDALFSRLQLTPEKAGNLSVYGRTIAALPCRLKKADFRMELANGLTLERIRYPLGLIAAIYESRPEVTVQVACLAIKSGNAFILKGGREAQNSNRCLFEIVQRTLKRYGLGDAAVFAENREQTRELLTMSKTVDLIIPRGGNEFVRYIKQHSDVPVLGHADGICHVYIDKYADAEKAKRIVVDAKLDYPAACNAVETVLYHSSQADTATKTLQALADRRVSLHVCPDTAKLLEKTGIPFKRISANTWSVEYGDIGVSVKQVASLRDAIQHINTYGSGHTDGIVTENDAHAETFMSDVDSASVIHNASTRFADGFVFGLGAEVGISTEKIHARGPVGIEGLLTTKFFLRSKNALGDIRHEYAANGKYFTHRPITD